MRTRGVLLLMTAIVLVAPAPHATAGPTVVHQAWAASGPVRTFVPEAQRIYVAVTGGSEEARAFIEIAFNDDDAETIGASTLVLTEGAGGLLPENASLAACALGEPLADDGELGRGPAVNCRVRTEASRSAGGDWRVPLDVFASAWSDAAPRGLALIADAPTSIATFRVSFDTARTSVFIPGRPGANGADDAAGTVAMPAAGPNTADPPTAAGDSLSPPPLAALSGAAVSTREAEAQSRRTAPPPSSSLAHTASGPSIGVIFGVLTAISVLAAVCLRWRRRRPSEGVAASPSRLRAIAAPAVGLGFLVSGTALREVTLYKIGLVLIVFVAAIGLHILVNWAGELSLAHASLVGAPAFVVAKLAADHNISPLYLLPLGILAGAALGALIGLPALRTKGLQVALVTLAAGITVDRFLFTKPWFVGPPGGAEVPAPRLGPFEFVSTRSLYPLLLICVAVAFGGALLLSRSKIARGLLWLRSDPNGAAAFGVPVTTYRLAAYAIAGAFGGFAGALSVVWVQRLTPGAFPMQLSFTYLMIVVLAGRGFVGGVAAAAAALEGGRLFVSGAGAVIAYAGPLALLVVLTRYKAGLNGLGAELMRRLRNAGLSRRAPNVLRAQRPIGSPSLIFGSVAIAAGFVAIGLSWFHIGNTDQLWLQNQEIVSGGFGGIALVVLGTGFLIRDCLMKLHAAIVAGFEAAPATSEREPIADAVSAEAGNGTLVARQRTAAAR